MTSERDRDDRVAVVTGGSRGMGRAIAARLSQSRAAICLVSRTEEDLVKAAREITRESKGEVFSIVGDVRQPELADDVIGQVVDRWGRIDILVNNAGGPPMGSFLEHDEEAWDDALQLNLRSVIRFSKAAVPHMKARKWGRIINISSTLAKEPTAPMVLSATARAGVSAFSKAISQELAPYNVTINTVCPGGVATDRLVSLVKQRAEAEGVPFEELYSARQANVPARRFAEPAEIADVVAFLASDGASYVTGTTIVVDGGLTKSVF